jgi:hypothetical protein
VSGTIIHQLAAKTINDRWTLADWDETGNHHHDS